MALGDHLDTSPTKADADAIDRDVTVRLGVKHLKTPASLLEAQSPSRAVVATRFLQYAIAHEDPQSLEYVRTNSLSKVFEEIQDGTLEETHRIPSTEDRDEKKQVSITTKQGVHMVFNRLFKETSDTREAIEGWVKAVREDYEAIENTC
ncbi:hypothetical protein C5C07_19220 [Haloferax sp. Atlit-4N]|uniref:hypothetical protein n=1 Tax=Haloferax sp. Atlit-4N TaxID=2077206 RepID=UPI000E23612C|nr:hypothetical protein [Haloferax sp. Atlit-4N]RDZ50454.1 hypothetical protein C5C07_19220 [Haloferax sp. Atlit-4N]